jgi:hypothetical protein
MPVFYDLRKDIRFKQGLAEGLAKSLEKLGKMKRTWTIRLLNQGVLSTALIAEGLDVPLDFVLNIQKELEKKPISKRVKKAN